MKKDYTEVEIKEIVTSVLAAMPDKVNNYKLGKTGLLGMFVGKAMKLTKGLGDAKMINSITIQELNKL